MDSSQVVLLCIFSLITLSKIRLASGKFEPLYLARNELVDSEWFELTFDVDEGEKPGDYVVKGKGRDILAACPLSEGPELYKIIEKHEKGKISIPIEKICAEPVKSRVYFAMEVDGANSIGFAILPQLPEEQPVEKVVENDADESTEDISISEDTFPYHRITESDEEDSDEVHPPKPQKLNETRQELDDDAIEDFSEQNQETPGEENDENDESNLQQQQNQQTPGEENDGNDESNLQQQQKKPKYEQVELMVFKFDHKIKRIIYTWYRIAPGKLLKPEITRTGKEIYDKNEYIYGFDVDEILYKEPSPFFKVQLAPEEDFFFESWKEASRQNMLTAPTWEGLRPIWQNLEIFIRRVTHIIDYIDVKTGVSGTLQERGDYSVPALFWKSIFIDFVYGTTRYKQGILFVMPNIIDSGEVYEKNVICPGDSKIVAETGWPRLVGVKGSTSMQVCLSNAKNMQSLIDDEHEDYAPLNLKEVPVKRVDDLGKETMVTINVLEILKKMGSLKVNSFGVAIPSSDEEDEELPVTVVESEVPA
ncbi:uncharacterized protein LOC135848750 [Planococcus citri]|uniref:uncharacterized protein LOC135848750 n=1 Tax=Planococcus citri TaxID=170843 RepID=UPI0031F9E8BD